MELVVEVTTAMSYKNEMKNEKKRQNKIETFKSIYGSRRQTHHPAKNITKIITVRRTHHSMHFSGFWFGWTVSDFVFFLALITAISTFRAAEMEKNEKEEKDDRMKRV